VKHFEDDDDNDYDSDDVEDVSVHGSWITRRCPRRQAILRDRHIPARFIRKHDHRRYIVHSDELLSAFLEFQAIVLCCDGLPVGHFTSKAVAISARQMTSNLPKLTA
jgi:hypothetical protein